MLGRSARSTVGLEFSSSPYVHGGAVKTTRYRREIVKTAGDRPKPPIAQCPHQGVPPLATITRSSSSISTFMLIHRLQVNIG